MSLERALEDASLKFLGKYFLCVEALTWLGMVPLLNVGIGWDALDLDVRNLVGGIFEVFGIAFLRGPLLVVLLRAWNCLCTCLVWIGNVLAFSLCDLEWQIIVAWILGRESIVLLRGGGFFSWLDFRYVLFARAYLH